METNAESFSRRHFPFTHSQKSSFPMSNCTVTVTGGELSATEIEAYKSHAFEKFGRMPSAIDIQLVDNDEVVLGYHFPGTKFDRIRRITGYLTGTLDTWNDAKRAEEHDRVKHATSCTCPSCS